MALFCIYTIIRCINIHNIIQLGDKNQSLLQCKIHHFEICDINIMLFSTMKRWTSVGGTCVFYYET